MDTTPTSPTTDIQLPVTPTTPAPAGAIPVPDPASTLTVTPVPVIATPAPVVEPATPAPAPQTPQPAVPVDQGPVVMVQVPLWKNPRILMAAAGAIIVIVAGVWFSNYSNSLKGSFDQFNVAVDYKIKSFAVTQAADTSMQLAYTIDKKATNLFMAVSKVGADDKPENDEMTKLIALSDVDLAAGDHKITITTDDVKTSFLAAATYRFQIIAYNEKDEITDFKAEKHAVTIDNGKVKLGDIIK